jgi:hypothetical protein
MSMDPMDLTCIERSLEDAVTKVHQHTLYLWLEVIPAKGKITTVEQL